MQMSLLNMQDLFVRYHDINFFEFKSLYKFEDYLGYRDKKIDNQR
ncbi:hypothetical protein LCGC14_0566080 [marine sediment metagenome]|uniref:Uncharacterized protein n=1 Tax=marine sediment metagenome TaxID=412755 RepID=A0A0F9RKF5_9ZZZZ